MSCNHLCMTRMDKTQIHRIPFDCNLSHTSRPLSFYTPNVCLLEICVHCSEAGPRAVARLLVAFTFRNLRMSLPSTAGVEVIPADQKLWDYCHRAVPPFTFLWWLTDRIVGESHVCAEVECRFFSISIAHELFKRRTDAHHWRDCCTKSFQTIFSVSRLP
jgi:hypothetical protein